MNQLMSLLLIFFFILGAVKWKGNQDHAFSAQREISSASSSPCEGKNFCAVIYLAPWCPHCRDAIGDTQTLITKSAGASNVGIRVVVGAGNEKTNFEMAQEFRSNGETDNDSRVARKLAVQGFPSYFVLDKEGSIVLSGQEAHEWLLQKFGLMAI